MSARKRVYSISPMERQLIDVVIGAPSARRIAEQLDRSRLVERAIVREMLEHVRLHWQRNERHEPHREARQGGGQQAVIVGDRVHGKVQAASRMHVSRRGVQQGDKGLVSPFAPRKTS